MNVPPQATPHWQTRVADVNIDIFFPTAVNCSSVTCPQLEGLHGPVPVMKRERYTFNTRSNNNGLNKNIYRAIEHSQVMRYRIRFGFCAPKDDTQIPYLMVFTWLKEIVHIAPPTLENEENYSRRTTIARKVLAQGSVDEQGPTIY